MKTMDKIQNEAGHKPGNVQSDIMKKLVKEEKIFAVLEKQREKTTPHGHLLQKSKSTHITKAGIYLVSLI